MTYNNEGNNGVPPCGMKRSVIVPVLGVAATRLITKDLR